MRNEKLHKKQFTQIKREEENFEKKDDRKECIVKKNKKWFNTKSIECHHHSRHHDVSLFCRIKKIYIKK
jgi:hypothetical protein